MGWPDDLKLKSSMTLFATVDENDSLCREVLYEFYGGKMDGETREFLGA